MSTAIERSVSRGREQVAYQSSGRGGAGNIRPSSSSRDPASRQAGPDDYSQSRGRELPATAAAPHTEKPRIVQSGRGGAGNMRSPSREAGIESRNALREEAKYVREHTNTDIPVSHGRGGAGNISNSRSRSRSRDPAATNPGNPAALNTIPSGTTLDRLPEEGTAHNQTTDGHHHSGFSKITNLFHRDSSNSRRNSRDVSRTRQSIEVPVGH
ncbi:hypothetical protein M408DRAFT_10282 [Serendipita vermifera MAFF 305830]|uniref:Uncharacterized protein n=1 Tax=Serendipita vermifera MAFF 305830 TaxID=933852 RepID=A0A0C2X8W8_SERVB|nr:hypothetical protein M408DRAFT_10282 [Serendipita vermifera MAFF 305830]